jgi:hypothetical protein
MYFKEKSVLLNFLLFFILLWKQIFTYFHQKIKPHIIYHNCAIVMIIKVCNCSNLILSCNLGASLETRGVLCWILPELSFWVISFVSSVESAGNWFIVGMNSHVFWSDSDSDSSAISTSSWAVISPVSNSSLRWRTSVFPKLLAGFTL